ncbi:MAG: CPBP family intramembrane glutamic endopeptidase [Candidatus Faecousia sp.]|nr:CPBP family intramembrane metalloprotease [Clostridiales bacterium]MDY6181867.1 CPBP family intramembrane glutamic endopeptidase [Candidatus Faecousia sp.]
MKKYRSLSTRQSEQEIICGWVYFILQLLVLPSCLIWLNAKAGYPLKDTELNFTFFALNFAVVVWIFRRFLSSSFRQVRVHPAYFCQAVILGLAAYLACSKGMNWLLARIAPGFSNANDTSIAALIRGNFTLTVIGTVLLVPPVEECFYRGLIFRPLYGKSPWAAYLVSMAAFSLAHIVGYLGSYSLWEMVVCFLQYLPAGLCLAWSYTKSDTIFAPIVIHALVNAWGIWQMR